MLAHLPRGRVAALIATVALLVIPAAAQAKTETASSGGVTASFTYHKAQFGFKGDTLSISRGGKVVYDAPVHGVFCGNQCWPGNFSGKSVHVLDLAHNGGREVVLELYSGGANCCFYVQVFHASGASYKQVTRFFGNPGVSLTDLNHNGRIEFVSGNPYFVGQFSSTAGSGFPIQILTFGHSAFHDVTRHYPKRIAKDATFWLRTFKKHLNDGEGVIAAWAADEYMLGRTTQANQYLNAQAKAGHLNALGSSLRGHRFVVALQKFLKKQGY